jgi:transposase-like protein
MLSGVSTRKYRRVQEPVGSEVEEDARSTSKSAVSRAFVQRTRDLLWKLMNRPLADLRLAVMMLDGIELHGRTNIVALGITTAGDKLALGLWEGSTENSTVASALLADLVDRGLDVEQGLLFVLDGGKALRKAVRQVFGSDAPVQRCVVHKECHEDGYVRPWLQPRGRSRLRGVRSCSSRMLGSIGPRAAPGGAH